MGDIAVQFNRISKSFGNSLILDKVSFECRFAESVALIGPNGSGKSTLLGVLCGHITPDSGTCRVNGAHGCGEVSVALQYPSLFMEDTVRGCLKFYLDLEGSNSESRRRYDYYTDLFAVSPLFGKKLKELSGGELQKVNLILALTKKSNIFVFDEPTTFLDSKSRNLFWKEIERKKMEGASIIYVTHNEEELKFFSNRIVMLYRATVFREGEYQELLNKFEYKNVYKVSFDNPSDKSYFLRQYTPPVGSVLLDTDACSFSIYMKTFSDPLKQFSEDVMYRVKNISVERFGLLDAFYLDGKGVFFER
jgi:ABC-type multidrug transport system ATPase subunit